MVGPRIRLELQREESSFLLNGSPSSKTDCLALRRGSWNSRALSCGSLSCFKHVKIWGLGGGFVRTHNRSRSPRFTASSRWNNADKGIRQIRSVTSGHGLALGAGSFFVMKGVVFCLEGFYFFLCIRVLKNTYLIAWTPYS